ncbi:MAG: hypothetical protein SVK08_07710 [Halobacteriota archaeon]|nr:hypothetical protein [Halobacteriota archaeon]
MQKILIKVVASLFVSVLLISAFPVGADTMGDVTSWVNVESTPIPQVMVKGYEVYPEALMPGDEGVLTVTLENVQDDPITEWKRGLRYDHQWAQYNDEVVDADSEVTLTMNTYLTKAYLTSKDVDIQNEYSKVGVIGPGRTVDLSFNIVVPDEVGIYMLGFYAEFEDLDGRNGKDVRYQIPIIVSSTVELIQVNAPSQIEEGDAIEIEVVNSGIGSAESISIVSDSDDITLRAPKIYVGSLEAGESKVVRFYVEEVTVEGQIELTLKSVYKNGINEHESDPLVISAYSVDISEEEKSPMFLSSVVRQIMVLLLLR